MSAVQTVTIKTAGRNLRRFEIDTRGNTVAVSSPYPGQGLLAIAPLNLFRESCRLYFAVPEGAEKVHVAVTPEEPASVTLLNAVGEPVASMPRQTSAATLTSDAKAGVWSLDVKAVEDVTLRLGAAVTPILATEALSGLVQAR